MRKLHIILSAILILGVLLTCPIILFIGKALHWPFEVSFFAGIAVSAVCGMLFIFINNRTTRRR